MKALILAMGRRPVACTMLAGVIVILGSSAVPRMALGLLPALASPGITITIRYPGVEPRKMEEMISIPVERQVGQIAGIEELISVSSSGESRTHAVFSYDSDVKIKLLEASEKIQQIRGNFPREVQEPVIVQYDPADRPVFIASLTSKIHDLRTLRTIADRHFKPRFERIEGISEVQASGGFEREIMVKLDPGRLAVQGIAPEQVGSFISQSNTFASGGRIRRASADEQSITMDSRFTSAREIAQSFLPAKSGTIALDSIGTVEDTFREQDSISRTNGEERVTLYVQKAGSANALGVSRQAREILGEINFSGVQTEIEYDQGEFIESAISQAVSSCVSGGLIAVLVLYVFLRRESLTLLIGLTLPACLAATLFIMYLAGIEINTITLSGLALASGMLIDNSIVVTESMESAIQSGSKHGALDGALAVSGEIVSATLSTVIVFLPLLFTDPATRKLYEGLAITVSASLLCSIVFSLLVLPALVHALPESLPRRIPSIERMLAPLDSGRLGHAVHGLTVRLMRHPARTFLVSLAICASLPVLFYLCPREALATAEERSLEASVDLPTGTHLAETSRIVAEIEQKIRAHPAVRDVSSRIENAHGSLHVRTRPDADSPERLIADLTARTEHPDAFVHFTRASDEAGNELDVEFYGDNQEELKAWAREAAGFLPQEVPGIERVLLRFREEKTDMVVRLDPLKLGEHTSSSAGGTLRSLLSGAVVTRLFDGEREIDVRVAGAAIRTPQDAAALILPGNQAVSTLSSIESEANDAKLWRKNKRRMVSISLQCTRSLPDAAADVEKALARTPNGIVFAFGNQFQKETRSQNQMLLSIALSIVLIYVLLGFLFESFVLPLLVIAPVPLSWAGIFAYSALFQMPLNMSVYIGMILLGGLVVNHSILVLTTIREAAKEAQPSSVTALLRLTLRASTARLRPIAMTAITTIAGVLPMILSTGDGSSLWRPLSITVACGLGIALVTSLALVPFLSFIYDLKKVRHEPA